MTLHEAIVKTLTMANKSMTTKELADTININKLYQKRDKSSITAYQIHGRTKNHPQLFNRAGSMVSLKGKMEAIIKPQILPEVRESNSVAIQIDNTDPTEKERLLMDEKRCLNVKAIEDIVPSLPGLYCIRIKKGEILPWPFKNELIKRQSNLLYIGIATKSLKRRFLEQELRAQGHGTFFRSLGAMLGFLPPFKSLKYKKNKRNYTFSEEDEKAIICWINENLLVNWVISNSELEDVETQLIRKHVPLLNIAKNPRSIGELSKLRKRCVEVANGKLQA